MKKLLVIAMVLILLLPLGAMAASWGQTEPVSPYRVELVPLTATTNLFGQATYQPYTAGAIKAGDAVHLAVRVIVPDKPAAATVYIRTTGITLNCAASAALPSTPGTYYLNSTGGWDNSYAVLTGVITNSTNAYITAEISGTVDIHGLKLGDISVTVDSGGYMYSTGRNSMYFGTYGSGQVYSTWVYGPAGNQRVSASLLAEDTELGSIARYYLRVLGIDSLDLMAGRVYMTPKLIQANFGTLVDTSATFTWSQTTITIPQTQPVVAVPATGVDWNAVGGVSAGVCMAALLWFVIRDRNRR